MPAVLHPWLFGGRVGFQRRTSRRWGYMTDPGRPCLLVCMTCRAGRQLAEGEIPAGALLHSALAARLSDTVQPPLVELRTTSCLANCERGCSAVIAMPGKWSYVLGHLAPDSASDLLLYAAAYALTPTGTVMPSRRPVSLARMVIARIPPLEFAA
jgi:predicted metal-binding protein